MLYMTYQQPKECQFEKSLEEEMCDGRDRS
jgi:hypothetical protein